VTKPEPSPGAGPQALKAFDLDDPELAPEIDAGALTSGGFPYHEKLGRKPYDQELERLQIELIKLQASLQKRGERLVVLFEGRDAAGKGSTIKRFMAHLNPRPRPGGGAQQAERGGGRTMVFPALRAIPAGGRQHRPIRPLLV